MFFSQASFTSGLKYTGIKDDDQHPSLANQVHKINTVRAPHRDSNVALLWRRVYGRCYEHSKIRPVLVNTEVLVQSLQLSGNRSSA